MQDGESSPRVTKIDLDLTTMSDNEELSRELDDENEADLLQKRECQPDNNLMKLRIPTTVGQNEDELMSLTDKINQAVLKLAIQSQERENHQAEQY